MNYCRIVIGFIGNEITAILLTIYIKVMRMILKIFLKVSLLEIFEVNKDFICLQKIYIIKCLNRFFFKKNYVKNKIK